MTDAETTHLEQDAVTVLRERGLRVTAPRMAVYTALHALPHATADEVTSHVRDHLGSVSNQAIYDVLAALEDAGLVRRIEPAGHPARFESRVLDNHHHVVCRTCGRIDDIDCAVGDTPCLDAGAASGFAIDEAEVTFWGVCPDCATTPLAPAPRQRTTR